MDVAAGHRMQGCGVLPVAAPPPPESVGPLHAWPFESALSLLGIAPTSVDSVITDIFHISCLFFLVRALLLPFIVFVCQTLYFNILRLPRFHVFLAVNDDF